MMDKKMSLEQVRDWHRENARVFKHSRIEGTTSIHDEMADAIDAELKARREPVGCLTISRFRGYDSMVNHDFDYYGDLPDGSYTVYTAPPAPKIEITDVMVKRAAKTILDAAFDVCFLDRVRAGFEAALKETP